MPLAWTLRDLTAVVVIQDSLEMEHCVKVSKHVTPVFNPLMGEFFFLSTWFFSKS